MTPAPSTVNSRRVPIEKRKRTETSCDKCKARKQKCRKDPGKDACRYCMAHGIECLTTQPRKTRLYGSVEGLGNRLALLEALVKGLLPEAELSNLESLRKLGVSLGLPLPGTSDGESSEVDGGASAEGEEPVSFLPDQQGQAQYIGPASSLAFYMKLRALVGQGQIKEFTLFGRNAAEPETTDTAPEHGNPHASNASSVDDYSSTASRRPSAADAPTLAPLMDAYFARINPDFPVLHEATFRAAYSQWVISPGRADPAWFCSLLAVVLLARRVVNTPFPADQERLWWRRVQHLLPVVGFTSSVSAVQALALVALHLHNTNHRDACWNITGTAIRIAYAIGLHQDKVNIMQTPLCRELRRRLWWSLYAFEQIQVSSYDRPSAIEHARTSVACPNERILGLDEHYPSDSWRWYNRLVELLAAACRAPKTFKLKGNEETYVGPLSPAASVLRDLDRWRETVPTYLRLEALETSLPVYQRPMLLLHAKYHYTVIVLSRAALYTRATLTKQGDGSINTALNSMSNSCIESGRALANIVLRIENFGKFDPVTWWDIWYAFTASSILVLDLVCTNSQHSEEVSESSVLLAQLTDLAIRHMRNPNMPGTIRAWAKIIPELHTAIASPSTAAAPQSCAPISSAHPSPPDQTQAPPYHFLGSPTTNGAYMFADNGPRFSTGPDFNGDRFLPMMMNDRNTEMNFMDFTVQNMPDWSWGDLGSLLGHEGMPMGSD